jgi:hypothetical protein
VADSREVDETSLRVRVDELHAYPVPDVHSRRALLDSALDGRFERAHIGPFGEAPVRGERLERPATVRNILALERGLASRCVTMSG